MSEITKDRKCRMEKWIDNLCGEVGKISGGRGKCNLVNGVRVE